jgi:hypothetical protein
MPHWLDGNITAALDHLLRPGELRRRARKWVILINDTWRKGALEQVSFQPTPDAARQVMAKIHTESHPTQLQPPLFPNPAASPNHLRYSAPSYTKRLLLYSLSLRS